MARAPPAPPPGENERTTMEQKMTTPDIKAKTRQFLAGHFQNHELKDDEDIFALGFVSSLLAMQLVQFVEKEFGITVDDDDLDIDNFRSIDKIAALVAGKLG